jgi:spermidine synthase
MAQGARCNGTMNLLVALFGALAGVFATVDLSATNGQARVSLSGIGPRLAVGALLGAVLLLLVRAVSRALVLRLAPSALDPRSAYARYDVYTFALFLLPALGMVGVHVSVPLAWAMLLSFAAAQLVLALRGAARVDRDVLQSDGYLALLFLFSGMAALIYEIVWQRVLYATFGINIESVTLIVAVFMFGLGLGALGGGALSKRFPRRLPEMFAAAELAIGAFGLVSVPLIGAVGDWAPHMSMTGVALVVFALMALPTILMGATLPILVAHVARHDPEIGPSLGRLYGLNTLGAALASILTVDTLFVVFGRQGAVYAAVALNVVVGALVYRFASRLRQRPHAPETAPPPSGGSLPAPWVLAMAALVGFISLSQEILWVRVIAFSTMSVPHAFGHVLGVFLIGVAAGAHSARSLCRLPERELLTKLAWRLLLSAVVGHLTAPLAARAMTVRVMDADKVLGIPVAYLGVGLGAFLLGAVLPVLAHVGARRGAEAGASVAWIYLANIAGCTAGPLVTAFVLLDRFSLESCALGLALLTALCAAALSLRTARDGRTARLAALAALPILVLLHGVAYRSFFERLLFGADYRPEIAFKHLVQNRSGVLAVAQEPLGDVMYGGGAYDGKFSIDAASNSNGIDRAYMMASLHRSPRRVLVIGLSTGSWVRVLAAHDAVERLSVVEINPGYERLIALYPGHRDILADPRIRYFHDDGRRWLKHHPDERFDFILMNTTYHFRSNITSLLSREFLELCRRHLEPGGVLYYNTTDSPDVVFTAAAVFPHVTLYGNFVAASDSPIALGDGERRAGLSRFTEGGRLLLSNELRARMVRYRLPDVGASYRARANLRLITDDNMVTEFRHRRDDIFTGKPYRWYDPERRWLNVLMF